MGEDGEANETNLSRETDCRLLQLKLQALQERFSGIIGGESRDDRDRQPEGLVLVFVFVSVIRDPPVVVQREREPERGI